MGSLPPARFCHPPSTRATQGEVGSADRPAVDGSTRRRPMTRPLGSGAFVGVSTLALAALALWAPPASGYQLQQLGTFNDVADGRVEDLAAPAWNGSTNRVWIANGRVRWAINATTGQRDTTQDRMFTAGSSNFTGRQRVLALEFDDANQRLITLTEAVIAVEPGPGPTSTLYTFDLLTDGGGGSNFKKIHINEDLLDVKVWSVGTDTQIFVLTTHRIISFK